MSHARHLDAKGYRAMKIGHSISREVAILSGFEPSVRIMTAGSSAYRAATINIR